MLKDIIFVEERHIGIVTLNRVNALNALTLPMIISLQEKLKIWQDDKNIHAVIINASPGKAFCAGGDVRNIYEYKDHDHQNQIKFFWHEYRLNNYIHHYKKPYIAMMDGFTFGGGVGISLHGSHPIASENFSFAMPETSIGFFPDIGSSYLLSRTPHNFGMFLALTGSRLNSHEAKSLGLVKYQISADNFSNAISTLIEADLSINPYEVVDECLNSFNMPIDENIISHSLEELVKNCFNGNDLETIIAKLEKSDDPKAQEIYNTLKLKSPLSLKVTYTEMQKAKSMTIDECIKMDYCLASHFLRGHDFYEGVRALLVDKDKSPKWQPNSIVDVTEDMVSEYFNFGQKDLPLLG